MHKNVQFYSWHEICPLDISLTDMVACCAACTAKQFLASRLLSSVCTTTTLRVEQQHSLDQQLPQVDCGPVEGEAQGQAGECGEGVAR